MHVCLVTSEFPPHIGGIASHVAELAQALAALGVTVTVVAPMDLTATRPVFDVPGITVLRPRLIKAQPSYGLVLRWWLKREIPRRHFDLVHVHGTRPLSGTSGLPVPVIFTNHSTGFLARLGASAKRRARTAALVQHVSYLLAPCNQFVEAVQSFGYAGPALMITNGVDITRFTPGDKHLRTSWGVGADEVVLLLARRLVPKNGIVWLARSLPLMANLPFKLVVAGTGPEQAEMVAIAESAGMADRLVFLGNVPNADMPRVYQASDVCVLPSLAEATSITGLEAMACGVPLVGTQIGGIPDLIDAGVTGLLVPARDPQAMATALEQLITDGALRQRMGLAARHAAETKFTWGAIAAQTLGAYEAALGGTFSAALEVAAHNAPPSPV